MYYLIEFLTHKTEIEKEYANGLLRLTRASLFVRGKNTMAPCLTRLQTMCNQQSMSLQELISFQQTDLIPALKDLMANQDEVIRNKAKNARDLDYELQKNISYCEKAKEYYFSYCSSDSPSKREESAGKKYLKTVEEGNKFLVYYEENMMPILMLYQRQEEDKIMTIKDVLRKLIIFELSYIRSIQYERDLLPMAIESLNPEIEIKKFIDDNISGKTISKFSFEVHPKRLNTDLLTNSSENEKKYVDILTIIIDKCWKGVLIDDEDNRNFIDVVIVAEGRKLWLQKLIEKKFEGKVNIPCCTFGIICGLTSSILDIIQDFQDLGFISSIVSLSQCFYEETLGQRTYMYHILLTHPIWENLKLWGNLIIISVNIEMESDAMICDEDSMSLNQALKLRPVLLSKINSFVQNMKNFLLDNQSILSVLKVIEEFYNIKLDCMQAINN
ncbi:hypothetical protein SteCoe_9023 [Stentor coeruleus]|uniref:Uncharacterized protein n=1 Tax=Stentor coeruleus TaxID=5963 RepID=A0A1R2CIT5_9CILI|nr:hypothetical protein SteCoe_9023 [Stentor coeruleus]